jgi:predicted ArsR family transcriptional regulator
MDRRPSHPEQTARGTEPTGTAGGATRLDVLKTLGDNTRYAIYLELARSPRPLSTADVADSLGLHLNTVRPHLERMREVGLLESRPDSSGAVGRPQKMYELASDAPGLGLEPPVYPMLASMLLQVAVDAGPDVDSVIEAGRRAGARLAHGPRTLGTCVDMTVTMLDELGFDPAAATDGELTAVAFGHCPFADLAEDQPQVVCSLHRGMLEGFCEEISESSGGPAVGSAEVASFSDIGARSPCRVDLASSPPGG